jgi:hypothetical protein
MLSLMRAALRELVPVACVAAAAGLLATTLQPAALLLVFACLGLGIVGLLMRVRSGSASAPGFPLATFLGAIAVLSVAWIGMRGPGHAPVSDLPFLALLALLALPALRDQRMFPVPGWLLWVAGGLAASALLAPLFVHHPPPVILSAASATTFGSVAAGSSDFSGLVRIEYALVLVPIVVGALTSSWGRARLFADLWLASAAISAAVGCADQLAGTGIAAALGVGPETTGPPGAAAVAPARAIGLTFHPNYLGLFSAMALPLAITRITQTSGVARVSAAAATVVLVVSIQLSGSRMGVIAACVGVAALLVLVPRFRPRVVIAGALLAATAIVLFLVVAPSDQSAIGRLLGDSTASDATVTRFSVISKSLAIGLDHPLTGVGFSRVFDSHSVPAQFLQAGGVLALASLALWAFGIGSLGVALSRNPRLPAHSAEIAAALSAGLIAWLLTGILSPQVAERFMYIPAGILLGLGLVAARLERSGEPPGGERAPQHGHPRPRAPARIPPQDLPRAEPTPVKQ